MKNPKKPDGSKAKVGRKPSLNPVIKKSVSMQPDDFAVLSGLGNGSISIGIRKAVAYARECVAAGGATRQ